jgi:SAM-dependent methyltransferase
MTADPATLRFYADEATAYAATGRGRASQHLDGFLARLATGARILELGCGDGRDSEAMLARGFDVDPTDGVEAMALEAGKRIGRPVRAMRFDELDAVEAYDAVWAHATLLHAPRSALPEVLSRVFRALKPGGLHFANFKTGDAEGRDRFGRYYNYPSVAEIEAAYGVAADRELVSVEEYEGGDYSGGRRPWVAITARRPAGEVGVRRAQLSDAAALKQVLQDTYESTWLPQLTPDAARAFREQNRPAAYVAEHGARFWVAECDGQVVGFVDWDGDFVNALHVRASYARRRIGHLLMDRAEAEIASAGFVEARLETDAFNTRSRAFYAGRGYREVEAYPDKEWDSGLTTLLLVKTFGAMGGQP